MLDTRVYRALTTQHVILQAQACADKLMEKVAQLNSRTLDLISAKCFFYYARVYELRGDLAGIRRWANAVALLTVVWGVETRGIERRTLCVTGIWSMW